jgi:hypothetical protein
MCEQSEDMGDHLREGGWRQGSVLSAATVALLADLLPAPSTAAVVTSQDCDIVKGEGTEPHIEIISGRVLEAPDNGYIHMRHPRVIHVTCADDRTHLSLDIRERRWVAKTLLRGQLPDPVRRLADRSVAMLATWIARRYTRPAFPDAFNERLAEVQEKLDRLTKQECSVPVTAVYVMMEDFEAELPADRVYDVALWFSCRPESLSAEGPRRHVYEFERRYIEIMSKCPGIRVVNNDVRSEDLISLSDLQEMRPLDYDARSWSPKPGGDRRVTVP